MSKRQFLSTLAAIPTTIGICHLVIYLKLGAPVDGWASLTALFMSVPGWIALARSK